MHGKQWKISLLLAAALLGLLCYSGRAEDAAALQARPLAAALAATGAETREFTVNGWQQLPSGDLSDTEMTARVEDGMRRLAGSDSYRITHSRSGAHRQVKGQLQKDGLEMVAILQVVYPSWEKSGSEVYYVINVEGKGNADAAAYYSEKIGRIMETDTGKPKVATCLLGWLDGKLEKDFCILKLNKAFSVIDAKVLDRTVYPDMISYSGFAPELGVGLTAGSKQINLNMAVRYSRYEDRTYIIAGSPVITREY